MQPIGYLVFLQPVLFKGQLQPIPNLSNSGYWMLESTDLFLFPDPQAESVASGEHYMTLVDQVDQSGATLSHSSASKIGCCSESDMTFLLWALTGPVGELVQSLL